MLEPRPFMAAMYYVPLKLVDVQAVTSKLTVRFLKKDEEQPDYEGEFEEEVTLDAENEELRCYDLTRPGYIGVPRDWGVKNLGSLGFVDTTVRPKKRPDLFPRTIKPRDAAQQRFMDEIRGLCQQPSPVDIVANARTGTGKTVTALWTIQNVLQFPTLVAVPTNKLRRQWYAAIESFFGVQWAQRYVGHIQQDKCDYAGRLIVLGLMPSLARRRYPRACERYFGAVIYDEWHKAGAPAMSNILNKFDASIRIGITATNRRDALRRVCDFHLGKPRIVSKQEVMKPRAYLVPYERRMPKGFEFASPFHMITTLSRLKDRNALLANLIYERGYLRDRVVVAMSDRTEQCIDVMQRLIDLGVEEERCGLFVGSYLTGKTRVNRKGNVVPERITMKPEEQDYVAKHCDFIFATWGIFDTGTDVPRIDQGVELTPRTNIRQGVGRVLRVMPNKKIPEWYSIRDTIHVQVRPDSFNSMGSFAPAPEYRPYDELDRIHEGRMASFADQQATVAELKVGD